MTRTLCKTRPFGVGTEAPDAAHIGGLTILLSEPRLYFMDVDGRRVAANNGTVAEPDAVAKGVYGADRSYASDNEATKVAGYNQQPDEQLYETSGARGTYLERTV